MYPRGCFYGTISRAAHLSTIPKYNITLHPHCTPELQQSATGQKHFVHQEISLRYSHAVAAKGGERNQQIPAFGRAIRQIETNSPSLSSITFDQALHDLGAESKETEGRESYSDQIPGLLPIQSAVPPKLKRSQKLSYGKNKEDKLFINLLLKDKGPESRDWRRILSRLLKYYTPKKIREVEDVHTSNRAASLVQTTGSHTQDPSGVYEIQSPVRRVYKASDIHESFRLARDISRPTEWSKANLAVYVKALARSQNQRYSALVPYAEKQRLNGRANIDDVVAAFDMVFYSMTSQKFLSIEACNTALRFFYDYGMIPQARSLFIRMEDLKMRISAKTFNLLLRAPASGKDLNSFGFLLDKMTRRGIKPDEETWILFLQVVDSSTVRAVIAWKMAEMNMLYRDGIRRAVAAHMISYEIDNHLGDVPDHHSFLDHMNKKYGIKWLSTSSGNKLLNEVAKRQSVEESLNLLREMKQAGFMPNDVSINTLLRHCLPLRRHELAIEVLEVFQTHYKEHPGPQAYETLLLQARRSRMLNFSIVIWRSACIHAAVSPRMKTFVFQSLLSYLTYLQNDILVYTTRSMSESGKKIPSDNTVKPNESSRSAKFKKFAGKFVIGVDGAREVELNQAMDNQELDPRRRTLKWAGILLESNLCVSRNCRLKNDMQQLLRQALTMDRTWAAEGLYDKDDWREYLPRAIAVDVKVKNAPTQTSTAPTESGSKYIAEPLANKIECT